MIHEAWGGLLTKILADGQPVNPRGHATLELLAQRLHLTDMRQNLIVSEARGMNYRFAVAEWLWMAFGRDDLAPLTRYNSQMAQYSDDGLTLTGAYGPRLMQQWNYVVNSLKLDISSRQAVTTIWRPNPTSSRDIPCTISMQFMIRGGRLHQIVTMRSSDAWLGVPYDVFSFTMLGIALAGQLNVVPGDFWLQLGSSHLYAENVEAARRVLSSPLATQRAPQLPGPPPSALEQILVNPRINLDRGLSWPWSYYGEVLRSENSKQALDMLKLANRG